MQLCLGRPPTDRPRIGFHRSHDNSDRRRATYKSPRYSTYEIAIALRSNLWSDSIPADRAITHALDYPVPAQERRRCSFSSAGGSENGGPEVNVVHDQLIVFNRFGRVEDPSILRAIPPRGVVSISPQYPIY